MTAGTQSIKRICNECVANMQGIYQKLEKESNDDDSWDSENKANMYRMCSKRE